MLSVLNTCTAIQRPRWCAKADWVPVAEPGGNMVAALTSEITLQLPALPPERPSSGAKLPLGHSGGFCLAYDHTAPLSPECLTEMQGVMSRGG